MNTDSSDDFFNIQWLILKIVILFRSHDFFRNELSNDSVTQMFDFVTYRKLKHWFFEGRNVCALVKQFNCGYLLEKNGMIIILVSIFNVLIKWYFKSNDKQYYVMNFFIVEYLFCIWVNTDCLSDKACG